jgi:hypothetical protein
MASNGASSGRCDDRHNGKHSLCKHYLCVQPTVISFSIKHLLKIRGIILLIISLLDFGALLTPKEFSFKNRIGL